MTPTPVARLNCLRLIAGWLILGASLAGAGESVPASKPVPPKGKPAVVEVTREDIARQAMSEITSKPMNGGTLWNRWLEDKGGGQRIAVWIPDGITEVRGVMFSMHRASEAERSELQAWCRSLDYVLLGGLIRWSGFQWLVPDQLADIGKASGPPEIANAPLVLMGFSRNCGASSNLARMLDGGAKRVLCCLYGGGPGTSINSADPSDLTLFKAVPILQINGDDDPFVGGLAWPTKVYPGIRATGLPFATAVDRRTGHGWKRSLALHIPFVAAMIAQRVPPGASTKAGPIKLKPWSDAGLLADPGSWNGLDLGEPMAAAAWTGSATAAAWLPDADTAASWRSFCSTQTPCEPQAESLPAGSVRLRLDPPPPTGATVLWKASSRDLGPGNGANGGLETRALATGAHSVHAELTVDGRRLLTRPIPVIAGAFADQLAGQKAAGRADLPINAAILADADRTTLQALQWRRDAVAATGTWREVLREDFAKDLDPARWYEYYHISPDSNEAKASDSTAKVVDGVLEVAGSKQAVAMLRYVWPDAVAVEYRCRAPDAKICDLSVVVAGRPAGRFPWNQGAMFQFGGTYNQATRFMIQEQPKAECAVRIVPGTWHQVRVERRQRLMTAWVDGVQATTYEMTEEEQDGIYSNRIGLYTFGSRGQYDDLRISIRASDQPAGSSNQPAMPGDAALDAAVAALIALAGSPWYDQRFSAEQLLKGYCLELLPAMRRALDRGTITDTGLADRLREVVAAAPPF